LKIPASAEERSIDLLRTLCRHNASGDMRALLDTLKQAQSLVTALDRAESARVRTMLAALNYRCGFPW
jgi:hypothetical protein